MYVVMNYLSYEFRIGASKGCELIYDGSCYRSAVLIDGITWSDAQSSCENWGGDLTSISSERENNLLFTMNTDAVSDTWLGLYDVDRNGSYQWIDGTLYDYTHWSTGNPSNNLNEDCIWMYPDSTWDDFPCYVSRRRYICKRNTSDIASELELIIHSDLPYLGTVLCP